MNRYFSIFLLLALNASLEAQTPYHPGRIEIEERSKKLKVLDSLGPKSIFRSSVNAKWLKGGLRFWYRNILRDSVPEYVYIDVAHGARTVVTRKVVDSLSKDSVLPVSFPRQWPRWASFSTDSFSPTNIGWLW